MILDNGAAESVYVSASKLLRDATYLDAYELVVPDTLGDAAETIQQARLFRRVAAIFSERRYMGVLQGQRVSDVMRVAEAFADLAYMQTWALPRLLSNRMGIMGRYKCWQKLRTLYPDKPIHFLGNSQYVREIEFLAQTDARGVDTCMPFVLAMNGVTIEETPLYIKRQDDYFTRERHDIDLGLVRHNLKWYCVAAGAETPAC